MASIKKRLSIIFEQAFITSGFAGSFGLVVESQRPDLGQFQCNGALAAAKQAKTNPRVLAQTIVELVQKESLIAHCSLAGPGFINISLNDQSIANHCNTMLKDQYVGCEITKKSKRVVLDYGSPNVAKPMHVGHLRSVIIGDSLQRLLSFLGYRVIRDNHIGDWGTPMGMLIAEIGRRHPDLPYFDGKREGPFPAESPITIEELEEMYPYASARCKSDEAAMADALEATEALQNGREGYIALWKHFVAQSIASLKSDYERLGIIFDYWLGESFYSERMKKLTKKLHDEGHAVLSEGALIIPISVPGEKKETPPLMLVKSGGGFLYATSDLATIEYRIETFKADRILYIVDQRQKLHFKQVFHAVRKAGIAPSGVIFEHIGFGTVNGTDGKPYKTRSGGVMKLKDLIHLVMQKAQERMEEANIAQGLCESERQATIHMVGIAALKFADLMNHRLSDYIFDIDKFSRFEGKTGPYLLYTAVRIQSILRKAQEQNIKEGEITTVSDHTRKLLVTLSQLPDVLQNTVDSYAPNYMCDFAFIVAQEFNRFYKECHILSEEDTTLQQSWLALSKLCLKELTLILTLLGITIPERM